MHHTSLPGLTAGFFGPRAPSPPSSHVAHPRCSFSAWSEHPQAGLEQTGQQWCEDAQGCSSVTQSL